jgi:hypothetical protein
VPAALGKAFDLQPAPPLPQMEVLRHSLIGQTTPAIPALDRQAAGLILFSAVSDALQSMLNGFSGHCSDF